MKHTKQFFSLTQTGLSVLKQQSATALVSLRAFALSAFCLLLFCFLPFQAKAQFSGGSGTSGDPYLITTPAQLAHLATVVNEGDIAYNTAHYRLENNLDLSDYGETWNDGRGWTPIGHGGYDWDPCSFLGVFNGNGKTITGLFHGGWYDDVGLFGNIKGATIQNLRLEDVDLNCRYSIGGIAGRVLEESLITNCYVSGNIISAHGSDGTNPNYAGGIAGRLLEGSVISNCFSAANITGNGPSNGGIVGMINNSGSVTNCYSSGEITAISQVGGIAGLIWNNGSITNCYSTATVNGTLTIGGIVGGMSSGNITDCAALNPAIIGTDQNISRVVGYREWGTLTNNIAFDGMLNGEGTTEWNNIGENQFDGEDISAEDIHADGTFGGRFSAENGWTTQNGKLPGLFGAAEDMPAHLSYTPVPPTIITSSLPNGETGEEYEERLIATGTKPISWTITDGDLPNDLTISTEGIISGIPSVVGTFEFEVTATNDLGHNSKTFTISIAEPLIPPVITTVTLPPAYLGTPYNFEFEATGTTPITWSLSGGSSIAGLTLSSAGILSGEPTIAGTFNFSVIATNTAGSDTKGLSITIGETGNIVGAEYFPPIRIFPNPTNGVLYIVGAEYFPPVNNIEIYDMTGRSVAIVETGHALSIRHATMDISHLPSGIYFLRIDNQTFKIVKQ